MELQAYALLCGLAAVVFTSTAVSRRSVGILTGALIISLMLVNPALLNLPLRPLVSVTPAQLAMLVVLGAALFLRKPHLSSPLVLLGGAMAAIWTTFLGAQGFPRPLVILLALALPLLTLWLALGRQNFKSPILLEEAMVLVLLAGLALVVIPEAIGGWQTGQALQTLDATATEAVGPGVLAITLISALLGALYVVYLNWKKR